MSIMSHYLHKVVYLAAKAPIHSEDMPLELAKDLDSIHWQVYVTTTHYKDMLNTELLLHYI